MLGSFYHDFIAIDKTELTFTGAFLCLITFKPCLT